MGKLMRACPAALLVLTACGSRGTHDDEPVIVNPGPLCEADEDCGDGAICFEGTCADLAATGEPDPTAPVTTASTTTAPPTTVTGTGGETTYPPDPDHGLSGVWVGYVEGSQFASGSDVVRVDINAEDCSPTATVTLGEGDALPPVTDPNVGYPNADPEAFELGGSLGKWFEGHAYTATDIELGENRVQLTIRGGEVWSEWCALQPSIETDGFYSCVENTSWTRQDDECAQIMPDGELVPHDCGHLALCTMGTCDCSESGCVASQGNGADLDVALDDGHLEGTFVGFGPVRLYRAE